jgi:hypothetical protein
MGIGGGIGVNMLSRRSLAKRLAGAFLLVVAARAGALRTRSNAVVSFFLDQPYLDMSGLGKPYRPQQGLRAGQPLARLSEQEFRNIAPHG